MKYIVFIFLTLYYLIDPNLAKAQIKIGKFSSQTTSDWVEVINETDTEINFAEYLIQDIAGNKIESEKVIPAKQNCVFDFSNRLNNAGDVIFLKRNGETLECVKYGDPDEGDCENVREPVDTKPSQNCFEKTPEPAPASPAGGPTVKLTPPPTPSTPKPTLPSRTAKPDPGSTESEDTVLAKATSESTDLPVIPAEAGIQNQESDPDYEEVPDHVRDDKNVNYPKLISLTTGSILMLSSAAFVGWKEYNETHANK